METLLVLVLALFFTPPLVGHHAEATPPAAKRGVPEDACKAYEQRYFSEKPAEKEPPSSAFGHSNHGSGFDEGPRRQARDEKGAAGKVHFPISCNEGAQKFFDQGVAQFHGFLWYEAERSFRQALFLD